MSKEVIYHKPVALLIEYRLIEKVDCKGLFKKLIVKVDWED